MSVALSLPFPFQMQQAEQAQIRQREANLTALAAIGPRRKRPLDSNGNQVCTVCIIILREWMEVLGYQCFHGICGRFSIFEIRWAGDLPGE